MDTSKNLMEIKDINKLEEALKTLLNEISKFHPKYPEYGYDYDDGKIVSVIREQREF